MTCEFYSTKLSLNCKRILFTALFFCGCFAISEAQVEPSSELYKQIMLQDSLIFEEGFNKCNFKSYNVIIADDLEFYHDKGGIQNKEEFIKTTKQNICADPEKKPIRKLLKQSVRVYPLYSEGKLYGAIQEGQHLFYIKENAKKLYLTGAAKFNNLYLLQDGDWILKRVQSYAHKSAQEYYDDEE